MLASASEPQRLEVLRAGRRRLLEARFVPTSERPVSPTKALSRKAAMTKLVVLRGGVTDPPVPARVRLTVRPPRDQGGEGDSEERCREVAHRSPV